MPNTSPKTQDRYRALASASAAEARKPSNKGGRRIRLLRAAAFYTRLAKTARE